MIFKLKEKDQALEESNKQIENLQRSVEKITELNDELDLLRPTSDKVCKLEALVDKYKNRLEEASEKLEKSKVSNERHINLCICFFNNGYV